MALLKVKEVHVQQVIFVPMEHQHRLDVVLEPTIQTVVKQSAFLVLLATTALRTRLHTMKLFAQLVTIVQLVQSTHSNTHVQQEHSLVLLVHNLRMTASLAHLGDTAQLVGLRVRLAYVQQDGTAVKDHGLTNQLTWVI
jgi:hypothetical protein